MFNFVRALTSSSSPTSVSRPTAEAALTHRARGAGLAVDSLAVVAVTIAAAATSGGEASAGSPLTYL
jgi:hypothetical protein